MEAFARVAEAVAARAGKLEKIALIAEHLRELDDADLVAAARFFTGSAFAARRVWDFDDVQLGTAYRGAALFSDRLTPASLDAFFGEIAAASGKNAGRRREAILERIFRACDDPDSESRSILLITAKLGRKSDIPRLGRRSA